MPNDKSMAEVTCIAMDDSQALSVPATKNIATESENSLTKLDHLSMIERMRWFQMIGTLAVILIIPTASIIAFCITQNSYCFAPCGLLIAPAWRLSNRITNFLFPQDTRDFQLEIAKVLKIHR